MRLINEIIVLCVLTLLITGSTNIFAQNIDLTETIALFNDAKLIKSDYLHWSEMEPNQKNDKLIKERISNLTRKLYLYEPRVSNITSLIFTKTIETTYAQMNINLVNKIHKYADLTNHLKSYDAILQTYYSNIEKLEGKTLKNLIDWNMSPDNDMQEIVERIQFLMMGRKTEYGNSVGLIKMMSSHLIGDIDSICGIHQSIQQILYNLYNSAVLFEIKHFIFLQFIQIINKMYGTGNYYSEIESDTNNFEKRLSDVIIDLNLLLVHANRVVYRCDPATHYEGKTYLQLTRLIQGYIVNEINLNEAQSCMHNCNHFKFVNAENVQCYKCAFCEQPRCNGEITNCSYINGDMSICLSSNSNTNRRYDNVLSSKDLLTLNTCPNMFRNISSWHNLFAHCSYCFCQCDDHTNSHRYFNLRETTSDIFNDKVITGLRFVKQNGVIHLQIQEGKLIGRTLIDSESVNWKPVDNYSITDEDVHNSVDYHTFTFDSRTIDLDDLVSHRNYVVTGVRFHVSKKHLYLSMRITAFDDKIGKLIRPEITSQWLANSHDIQRKAIKLNDPKIPTESTRSFIYSNGYRYVDFTHSSFAADVGQTTVPFFDAQDVITNPPMPLGGIGIFHKTATKYGGFIAPKIITYYLKHTN